MSTEPIAVPCNSGIFIISATIEGEIQTRITEQKLLDLAEPSIVAVAAACNGIKSIEAMEDTVHYSGGGTLFTIKVRFEPMDATTPMTSTISIADVMRKTMQRIFMDIKLAYAPDLFMSPRDQRYAPMNEFIASGMAKIRNGDRRG